MKKVNSISLWQIAWSLAFYLHYYEYEINGQNQIQLSTAPVENRIEYQFGSHLQIKYLFIFNSVFDICIGAQLIQIHIGRDKGLPTKVIPFLKLKSTWIRTNHVG